MSRRNQMRSRGYSTRPRRQPRARGNSSRGGASFSQLLLSLLLLGVLYLCLTGHYLLCCCVLCTALPLYFAIARLLYRRTTYYAMTKKPYLAMLRDTGAHGEYLTYRELRRYEKKGACFLFNVYIPKADGGTTEIDALMLSRKGIFVFESKNYGGWIFGDENAETWYQTFPNGFKDSFFSPIFQNRGHIHHLREFLERDILVHSVIVFSKRCTLKSVHWTPSEVTVTKRGMLARDVRRIWHNTADVLSDCEVDELYGRLHPLTQVSDEVKQAHVAEIQRKYGQS